MDAPTAQVIVGSAGAAVAFTGLLVQNMRRKTTERDDLEQDLRILHALPTSTGQAEALVANIEERIASLITSTAARRDPLGIALGLSFLAIGLVTIVFGFVAGGWGRLILVPGGLMLLLGVGGLVQDAFPRQRDSRGRPIRD